MTSYYTATPDLSPFEIRLIQKYESEIMYFTHMLVKVTLSDRPDIEARFDALPKVVQQEAFERLLQQLDNS